MNVLLFCNLTYGAPFARRFCDMALEGSELNRTIVLSSHSHVSTPRELSRKLKLLWTMRRLRTGCQIIFSQDINSDEFARSIPEDTIGIVSGFNQIFSAEAIRRFQSLVNFHPSVLPMYRGAIPSYWCIRNGETMTGFTLHKIAERIDAGEILYQEYTRIQPTDTEEILDQRIATQAIPVLERYIRSLRSDKSFRRQVIRPPYQTQVNYVPAKRP